MSKEKGIPTTGHSPDIAHYGAVAVLAAIATLVLFYGSLIAGIGILGISICALFDTGYQSYSNPRYESRL